MTSEQLKAFRLRAIQQGYSPQEISDYLASGDSYEDRQRFQKEKSIKAQPLPVPQGNEGGRNIFQKAADFLGIEKFGQGIATAARTFTGAGNQTVNENAAAITELSDIHKRYPVGSPERNEAVRKYNKRYESGIATQEDIDPGTKLSNKEVLGSAANVALNVATPGAFKGSLGVQAAKSATIGAGFGAAAGLTDKKDLLGIVRSAVSGAVVGGALPVAGKVLNKTAGRVREKLTQDLPESLMNHAIKPTLNELKKNIKTGSPTLGKELLKEGVAGSPEKLLKISDQRLGIYENKLQEVLKNSKGVITREKLRPYFSDVIEKMQMTPGSKDAVVKIESLLADIPEQMDLVTANKVKRNLYDRLRDVAYKLDPNLSDTAQAMKTLARALKEEIEKSSSNPVTIREINQRLSIYGRLEDRVVDILARDSRNKVISLTDTIAGAAGFINPLAWAGLLTKKGLESEAVLTNVAKSLNKMSTVGSGKIMRGSKAITKRALLNAP